jgi:hypothetical protein
MLAVLCLLSYACCPMLAVLGLLFLAVEPSFPYFQCLMFVSIFCCSALRQTSSGRMDEAIEILLG